MKRVATAAVLIPLVLWAILSNTPFLPWIVGIVAILATKEYLDIVTRYGVRPMRWPAYAGVGGLFLLQYAKSVDPLLSAALATLLLCVVLSLACLAMRHEDLREGALAMALTAFAFPYIGLTLFCLLVLNNSSVGWFFVILVFLAVWIGDTAAYYVGRSMGRHGLAPRISPKKTWEGAIASALFSAIVVTLWAKYAIRDLRPEDLPAHGMLVPNSLFLLHSSLLVAFFCGLIINIAAQLGDLAESMIKRGAGVKDSGTILPGHGGILDRIDALLFAAPVALLLFTLLDRYLPAR